MTHSHTHMEAYAIIAHACASYSMHMGETKTQTGTRTLLFVTQKQWKCSWYGHMYEKEKKEFEKRQK